MRAYITSIIVTAETELAGRNNEPGMRVVNPDGFAHWVKMSRFESDYREISPHERILLEQTDAEHQVSAISDGASEDAPCKRYVAGDYDVNKDETLCARCNGTKADHDKPNPDLGEAAYCEKYVQGHYDEDIVQFRCANCHGRRSRHP